MPFDPKEMTQANLQNMEIDADLGAVDLPRITAQQRYFIAARVGGMNVAQAAKEVGCHRDVGYRWEKKPEIQAHMRHYEEEFTKQVLPRIQFTTETAHQMYMNAYHSAGTSAEMTRATDSLVKLHGLLDKPESERALPTHAKQLEGLSTQELLRFASIGMDTLRPGEVYDAEYTEDEDE
ncbi:hypothetical protein [Vreelandella massiliensis]|uniref:hypothetical protein n=1 Tax=Vreelandella massiliensis TaxID=1816686 RepID=UPI00096AA9AF|nr:hypothetical protein [Halomonas massiliensis]